MIFSEKIGLFKFVIFLIQKKEIFYYQKTYGTLILEKIFNRLSIFHKQIIKIKKMEWGDTIYMTDALKNASLNAKLYCDYYMNNNSKIFKNSDRIFNIDFLLIFRKYIMAHLFYRKYFFYELSMQYTREHPEENHYFYIHNNHSWNYKKKMDAYGKVSFIKGNPIAGYIASILSMFILSTLYCRSNTKKDSINYDDKVICFVSSLKEYECYKDLFGTGANVIYVTRNIYLQYFPEEQLSESAIQLLGLNKTSLAELRRETKKYINFMLNNFRNLYIFGFDIALLYYKIILARSIAPYGKRNVFLTFEHHDLIKTIRNEFIKSEGSRTVFFSYLPGIALRYFPEEYFPNYDYVCSSGRYLEDQFMENESTEKYFLRVGCYTTHKGVVNKEGYSTRLGELKLFKENYITITILSPGICKPTYHSEVRLMELVQKLSTYPGIRIFIRKKPFVPEPEYADFYESYIAGSHSVRLTGDEFELFDFLPVTDLFITSYSTSACELAMQGGNIFFIDFMKQPDRFLFWDTKICNGILLSSEESYKRIIDWINDEENGLIRTSHRKAMNRFREYMEYNYPDYKTYKDNLIDQLKQNVFIKMEEK